MTRCSHTTYHPVTTGTRRSALALHAKARRDKYRNTPSFAGSIKRESTQYEYAATVPELRKKAKTLGIRGYSKMNKTQLSEALSWYDSKALS